MALTYDLHIHSCLSPCGDEDMTPGNIVGMAAVKGLSMIAVTDHNSCKNCPAAMKLGEQYGVMVIPGMELTTMEEVHVVCLFGALRDALAFDEYVYERLLDVKNDENIFGKQQIRNEEDEVIGTVEKLLINATTISFDEVYDLMEEFHGVMIPAHIDKQANSLLANLGFIPPDSRFTTVEVRDMKQLHSLQKGNPYLLKCQAISDSDAHYLPDINEPDMTLNVEKNVAAVIEKLRNYQI